MAPLHPYVNRIVIRAHYARLRERVYPMSVTTQRGFLGDTATPTPPGYYTEAEVMAMLGVTRTTLVAWPSQGKGPPRTRAGNRILYAKDAFHQWLASREKAAAA